MKKGLISVLIPMYNSEEYIERCLYSVLNQTYQDFEVIVLDDGSVDNSYEIVSQIAKDNSKIKLYKKENEKSLAKTRNYLLSKISGEYFIFVDSDDEVSPLFLELLLNSIEKSNSDISCCNFSMIRKHFNKTYRLKSLKSYNRKEALLEMILGVDGHFMVWNKLIKSELIKDIKFDEILNYGEDFIFIFNLMQKELKVSMIKNKLYYYRLRKGSISGGGLTDSKRNFLSKMILMADNSKYKNDKDVLCSWIYITSALYLMLIKSNKMEKDYKNYLKNNMKEYFLYYNQMKRNIRKVYRILMNVIKFIKRVKVRG